MNTSKEQIESFMNLYDQVFDTNGNVKACGRSKCSQLIMLSNLMENDIRHGNSITQRMDVVAIKNLYKKLKDTMDKENNLKK